MLKRLFSASLAFAAMIAAVSAASAADIQMVKLKGECFQMGDTFNDGVEDEKPAHKVCLKDFSIGKFEVSQKEWQDLMGSNPSNFKGDNLPVENVSWNDIQGFLAKLKETTGNSYRLPTEAEWEFAARSAAGEKWSGASNEKDAHDFAWLEKSSEEKSHPVGSKKANASGIHDLTGNVAEWCRDWYSEKYYTESPAGFPLGPKEGGSKVVRGGSWVDDEWSARAIRRGGRNPGNRTSYIGFRVAISGH